MRKIDSKTYEVAEGLSLVMDDCGHPHYAIVSTRAGDPEWAPYEIESALKHEGIQVWCDEATWHHARDWSSILVHEGGYHENGPKTMTFKQTKAQHLDSLEGKGWQISSRTLKVPYATSPDGQWRLWFKTQAVYFQHVYPERGGRFDFGEARSLTDDMRVSAAELTRKIDIASEWDRQHEHRANAGSGYTSCPCCGYDTVSSDMDEPELCSECEEAGCAEDGSDQRCSPEDDMRENASERTGHFRVYDKDEKPVGGEWATYSAAAAWAKAHVRGFWTVRETDRYSNRLRRNSSEHWVWAVDRKGEPLTAEGPWGPYDYQAARSFARIGATEGKHDRAVSQGRDPKAASFEILRVYAAGTGEHKYGVAQRIGAPMAANTRHRRAHGR